VIVYQAVHAIPLSKVTVLFKGRISLIINVLQQNFVNIAFFPNLFRRTFLQFNAVLLAKLGASYITQIAYYKQDTHVSFVV
jgi:hypothetical protein